MSEPRPRVPMRAPRAAMFAAVCVALAAVGHAHMSGTDIPLPWLLGAFAATAALAWTAAGRRCGPLGITTALLAVQAALHVTFSAAQGPTPTAAHHHPGTTHAGAGPGHAHTPAHAVPGPDRATAPAGAGFGPAADAAGGAAHAPGAAHAGDAAGAGFGHASGLADAGSAHASGLADAAHAPGAAGAGMGHGPGLADAGSAHVSGLADAAGAAHAGGVHDPAALAHSAGLIDPAGVADAAGMAHSGMAHAAGMADGMADGMASTTGTADGMAGLADLLGMAGHGGFGMVAAHLLAGLFCALWLAWGEAAVFRLAGALGATALLAARPLARVLALLRTRPVPVPGPPAQRPSYRPPRRLRGAVHAHTAVRRGPPLRRDTRTTALRPLPARAA
ncbi:hypothetical protein [Streptomyces sp. NPDC001594]|uniref:hypothetical protein n=1 Tax=Streptomyces sp. NPDC001594 TaxID=3364590 RepID=UPI00369D42D6